MSARTQALARRYFEEVLNGRDLAAVDQIVGSEFALYAPPSLSAAAILRGPEELKQLVAALHASFPDLHFALGSAVADEKVAMVEWTMRGTHDGPWLGVPATGREVVMVGVDVFRVADERLVEARIHGDYLGALRQLGALPG